MRQRLADLTEMQRRTFDDMMRSAVESRMTAVDLTGCINQALGTNFGRSTIQEHLMKYKTSQPAPVAVTSNEPVEKLKIEGSDSESKTIESISGKVRTVEDALAKAEVNLDIWEIERFVINSWEVGAKGPDGRITTSPLWQVKVWLKAKKGWNVHEFRSMLLEDLKKQAPVYDKIHRHEPREPFLLELSIFDTHFGKLAWEPETGQSYDLQICRDRYLDAAFSLLERAKPYRPERVLYVVGNDFYHTDQGRSGLTTNGTPQDCDGRWQKAFRVGKECAIEVIEAARQLGPVDVMIVPGNHDTEKIFCLGEVLEGRFHNADDVNVMNGPDVYSYYRWGNVLLGFVHGENFMREKKRADLPLIMATDCPNDWSETIWREFHLGHTHSEREDIWKYRTTEHIRDVAIRVLPSLSSTDAWHRRMGYKSVLSAEAHMYHKDHGRYQYFVHVARDCD